MRRPFAVMLLVIALLMQAVAHTDTVIAWQEGTPAAAQEMMLPEGVTVEPLAIDSTEAVPPPPATMELIRFTFEPGAEIHLPEQSPSTALVLVESGVLTAQVAAPITVTRSGVGGQREEVAAGAEFMADTGDFFIGPAHAAVDARNAGDEPLVLLMAVIEPAGVPPPVMAPAGGTPVP